MANIAGAEAAILTRFQANWNRTPIALPNGPEIDKANSDGDFQPWVFFETGVSTSNLRGVGRPGDQLWEYLGLITIHVFVPVGVGAAPAKALATEAGEIFRAAEFYRDTPGCCVRSWAPRIDGGGPATDDKNWWRVTATIPFEYLHRG
ncbi:phage tail terminator-like protein [Aureimonas sp. N4]|uniref:phage tail terminator-like protein n=1 Tax=Aureimonas sp. N4 TaxID=1638165 RepID=UPI000780561D|nr:phage tail terminator-like protein [Aureimonas sp. N4]